MRDYTDLAVSLSAIAAMLQVIRCILRTGPTAHLSTRSLSVFSIAAGVAAVGFALADSTHSTFMLSAVSGLLASAVTAAIVADTLLRVEH